MSMTYLEAATSVLQATPGGGPLHYREVCSRAMEQGFLQTEGKTPWQTMGSRLYVAIRDDEEAGKPPRFIQTGKGLFQLARRAPSVGIDHLVMQTRSKTRQALLERLKEIHPSRFEQVVARLLTLIGFEDVEVRGRSGDRGIDAVGRLTVGGITNVLTAIQAKRWSGTVPSRVVREMRGSLEIGQRGTIITTSQFSPDGLSEAAAPGKEPISLIDGEKLVDLMVKYEYGVKKRSVELLELDLEVLDDDDSDGISTPGDDGKSLSIWPLPSASGGYIEVLLSSLREVGPSGCSRDDLANWFLETFPKVKSPRTAAGYVSALRYSGFLQYDGETLKLTRPAQAWLADPSPREALEIFRDSVLGVEEILGWLQSKALSANQVLERLNAHFSQLSWETNAQTKIRLTWLEQLGAVEKSGSLYRATRQC